MLTLVYPGTEGADRQLTVEKAVLFSNPVIGLVASDAGVVFTDAETDRKISVTWKELRQAVASGTLATACRYAVVADGDLVEVKLTENEARERMAYYRQQGQECRLVRLPVDPV